MGIIGSALIELGRLREVQRRWSSFAHEARLHGDIKTAIWIHAHPAALVVAMMRDDPALAQTVLDRHARLYDGNPRYSVLRWSHVACQIEHELYWGSPEEAARLVRREWRALFATGYTVLNQEARYVRTRALLAAAAVADGRSRRRLLRQAAADAKSLRRSRPLHRGIAFIVDATIAHLRGETEQAAASLAAASGWYSRCDMRVFAVCTEYTRACLDGAPDAAERRASALEALRTEGIVDPLHWIRWYVVGMRGALSSPT